MLKKAFDAFDHEKKGCIGTDMVGTILTMLGYELSEKTLQEIIKEVDEDGKQDFAVRPHFTARTICVLGASS